MATAISATLPPVTYVPDDQTSEVQLFYQQGLSSAEIYDSGFIGGGR